MRAIELIHLRKRFGQTVAVNGVSWALRPGRVYGLLGENGAGKSTLMHLLYGMVRPDAGEIRLDGRAVTIRSPRDAAELGIGMVHQHFMLAPAMSVLDNVLLGDRRQPQWLDRRRASARLMELAARLDLSVDVNARVETLSVGQQQRVEILKALFRDVKVLILDEPTASLAPGEVEPLLQAMKRLRDEGKTILFISHKLAEVRWVCDEVAVMRQGEMVWQGNPAEASNAELAARMVAEGNDRKETRQVDGARTDYGRQTVLQLDAVATEGLAPTTLAVEAEILGVAGVDGNGQEAMAEAIVGLRRVRSGRIRLDGLEITHTSPAGRMQRGVAHIPADRRREGLAAPMSIVENLVLKHHGRRPFSTWGFMRWGAARDVAETIKRNFGIRCNSVDQPATELSGGNQQKVVLARELALSEPRVVVAMNPTRGLDPAASEFVQRQLVACSRAGAAVILISSDLDELTAWSGRIAVMFRGRLEMTRFPREAAGEIGRRMAGVEESD